MTQLYAVVYRINREWTETIEVAAHNRVEAVPIAKRWILKRCGKIAVRNGQIKDIIPIQG